jgi:methylmalonyl-CoA mutase, N-terminal domain
MGREIEESAYTAQRELEQGERLVVGVNAFRETDAAAPPLLSIDPHVERDQVERLARFRAARESKACEAALARLSGDAREDRNLMPPILSSVTAGATLGEVVRTLKTVFGEHRSSG